MTTAESPSVHERGRASAADVQRMMSKLLVTEGPDRRNKLSAFWMLLGLAAIIASAGVVADSTATVIGAMIVAPLMTPILGTALSVVLANRRLILLNAGMVLAGAAAVVAIGFVLGLTTQIHMVAETNSQIAARVAPRLIDLLAALATGVVGAFATVRSDISDTLPGVAIAISLVPPLAVVGLALESGAPGQALGALLLFGTNVSAIIATGTLIFLAYRVREAAIEAGVTVGMFSKASLATALGSVALLAAPLSVGSAVVVQQELMVSRATPVVRQWAESQGGQLSDISYRDGSLRIIAIGRLPGIQEAGLRERLDAAGMSDVDVKVTLVIGGVKELPGK